MGLIIQKYGGTSVGSIERLQAIANHLNDIVAKKNKVVVVVSAMGKQTNELHNMALELSSHPPKRELDMLLTVGERISMSLLSIACQELGMSAVSLTGSQCGILTDDIHGNARIKTILGDRIRGSLKTHDLVIVAGFQGYSPSSKEITTLGRGGSDLSALAIAQALSADECEIYTDVDGVFNADPRLHANAKVIKTLSWDTMSQISWSGAGVLHPRAAHVASKFKIPVTLRSSFQLNNRGTLIEGKVKMESVELISLSQVENQSLIKIRWQEPAASGKAQSWLWEQGVSPLINQFCKTTDGIESTQLVPTKLLSNYEKYLMEGKHSCQVVEGELACLSLIGEGFNQSPETLELCLEAIKVDIQFFYSSNSRLCFCVNQQDMAETGKNLLLLIENSKKPK